MKHFFLLLCLFCQLAHAEPRYHLVRIVATGSNRYSSEDVARASGLTVNTQVTMDDLQNAASRLGTCGVFSTVQFLYKPVAGTRDGVEANFQVKDAEKFLPAAFENIIWLSDQDLQQQLHQSLPLYAGLVPLSGTMADDISAALTKLLTAKGLPSQVSYMVYADFGRPPSAYKFKVENAGLNVAEVRVSGAARMAPDLITKSLSRVPGTEYLRSEMMRMVQLSLEPIYRDHGFLKFKIVEIKSQLKPGGGVMLEAVVEEGTQYRLAGFSWSGNTLIPSDELSKHITLKVGDPVDDSKLTHDLSETRKLFLKFGHERALIFPQPNFTADSDTVSYVFTVKEGELYHMGRLEIESRDADLARKLTESWKLAAGAPYDNTYLKQFLVQALPLAHGHQKDWVIFEQVDDAQKSVNVRLQLKSD
ncbi:MAG TPA: POTRA domain-containing protein [Candidatus Angelobacter sp.]|nr:POTRA domain-containing protein [Candidatus Angelobacter sp.]